MWALTINETDVIKVFRQPEAFERVIPNPDYPMEVPELPEDATPEQVADHTLLEVLAEQVPQTLTVQEPKEVFTLWTEEQRQAIGIKPIVQDDQPDPWVSTVTGSSFEVLGAIVAEHWTTVSTTADARKELKRSAVNQKISEVTMHMETLRAEGMPYANKVLQLRAEDQDNITAKGALAKFSLVLSGGASWPAQFGWIMMDNTVLPLDAQGMSDMADEAEAEITQWIFVRHQKKEALRAMVDDVNATLQDVLDFDVVSGWRSN